MTFFNEEGDWVNTMGEMGRDGPWSNKRRGTDVWLLPYSVSQFDRLVQSPKRSKP